MSDNIAAQVSGVLRELRDERLEAIARLDKIDADIAYWRRQCRHAAANLAYVERPQDAALVVCCGVCGECLTTLPPGGVVFIPGVCGE